jgi:hypothetical protein
MTRNLTRLALWIALAVVGSALLVMLAYFVTGSLEQFPTDEQQNKVRVVTGVLATILLAIEIGLWSLLRHTKPRAPG